MSVSEDIVILAGQQSKTAQDKSSSGHKRKKVQRKIPPLSQMKVTNCVLDHREEKAALVIVADVALACDGQKKSLDIPYFL